MQATHIRFALRLAQDLEIESMGRYLAGAIYPDSRYVTGVPRHITHPYDTHLDPHKDGFSDFEKGWSTHLLYDSLQGRHLKDIFDIDKIVGQNEDWIKITAAKFLEEEISVQQHEVIYAFSNIHPPTHEDIGEHDVTHWYDLQKAFYSAGPTSLEDFHDLVKHSPGFPKNDIFTVAKELQQNAEMHETIIGIYDKVVNEYERL